MGEEKQSKKIIVDDIDDEVDQKSDQDIKVKKSRRLYNLAKRKDDMNHEVENFYTNKDFNHLQKPIVIGLGRTWMVIILAIVFGLASGSLASFYILNNLSDMPQNKQEKDLAVSADVVSEQDKDTDLELTSFKEVFLGGGEQDLGANVWRVFKAKTVLDGKELQFLEQIYAPWQTISSAVLITNDGLLISSGGLDSETNYVVIDNDNNILIIKEVITDSTTGVNFLLMNTECPSDTECPNLRTVAVASYDEITPGQRVVVLDKFKNPHLTEISQIKSRNIYKTEDLVRSTDRFADFIRLDFETPLGLFPGGLIFTLDKKLAGLIANKNIVPAWHFNGMFDQILQDKKLARPFLGIDYLRIEEAPGLTSDLFKTLTSGAIVYGPPTSGGPADKIGIKNADVIVKIDDIILNKNHNLTYLIQQKKPGDTVSLTVLRKGEEMVFNIVLEILD